MDEGAGPDDDLAWAPPSGPPQPEMPFPNTPPPAVVEPDGVDRGGAAIAAGLFGGIAGVTLPPLLFWVTFSLFFAFGAPDVVTAGAAFIVAFGIPVLIFGWLIHLLGSSSTRYRGSRTALSVAAGATMGMWLFIAIVATLIILVLRSIG